jgi:hypothetical protein
MKSGIRIIRHMMPEKPKSDNVPPRGKDHMVEVLIRKQGEALKSLEPNPRHTCVIFGLEDGYTYGSTDRPQYDWWKS